MNDIYQNIWVYEHSKLISLLLSIVVLHSSRHSCPMVLSPHSLNSSFEFFFSMSLCKDRVCFVEDCLNFMNEKMISLYIGTCTSNITYWRRDYSYMRNTLLYSARFDGWISTKAFPATMMMWLKIFLPL